MARRKLYQLNGRVIFVDENGQGFSFNPVDIQETTTTDGLGIKVFDTIRNASIFETKAYRVENGGIQDEINSLADEDGVPYLNVQTVKTLVSNFIKPSGNGGGVSPGGYSGCSLEYLITSKADFPSPVGGVSTLQAGKYIICGQITDIDFSLDTSAGVTIVGINPIISAIVTNPAFSNPLFVGVGNTDISNIAFAGITDLANINGTGTNFFRFSDCFIQLCTSLGTYQNIGNFILQNVDIMNVTQGFLFGGIIDTIRLDTVGISNCTGVALGRFAPSLQITNRLLSNASMVNVGSAYNFQENDFQKDGAFQLIDGNYQNVAVFSPVSKTSLKSLWNSNIGNSAENIFVGGGWTQNISQTTTISNLDTYENLLLTLTANPENTWVSIETIAGITGLRYNSKISRNLRINAVFGFVGSNRRVYNLKFIIAETDGVTINPPIYEREFPSFTTLGGIASNRAENVTLNDYKELKKDYFLYLQIQQTEGVLSNIAIDENSTFFVS